MGIHLLNIKRAVAAIVLVCSMGVAYAADFVVDGISYKILSADDKTCAVTASETGYTGDIVVPATVTNGDNEYAVIRINDYSFKGCAGLENIIIPNSVTMLGNGIFSGCTALKDLELPESVTVIPNSMCMSCSGLESIVIRGQVTEIAQYAFYNCESLSSFKIYTTTPPNIGNNTFKNVPEGMILQVPAESLNAYLEDSSWKIFEINPVPTKIEVVMVEHSKIEYYNILGVKVENPTKGLYIKRCGNKAYKVML